VVICPRGRWAFICLGGLVGRGRVERCVGTYACKWPTRARASRETCKALMGVSGGLGGRGRVESGYKRAPAPLYALYRGYSIGREV
jgi:hypothetical protein